jgi:hypothetical protein
MSQENVEIVERVLSAMSEGDAETALRSSIPTS